jgi:cyclase
MAEPKSNQILKSKNMFAGAGKVIFERAAMLRRTQTHAEEILWNYLRTKPLGYKFRRQHAFSNFILDFYCHALQLAIEVDGSIHRIQEVKEKDKWRQVQLEELGLTVLRFTNDDVLLESERTTRTIENYLKSKAAS